MSLLRIGGIVVALVLGYIVVRGISRRAPTVTDGIGFLAALILLLVSLFPSLVNIPTDLLSLGRSPRGRLMSLLVVSALALWVYTFWSNSQNRRFRENMTSQLESLIGIISAQGAPSEIDGIAVVMPAYNEEEAVGHVVRDLPKEVLGHRVHAVVVSDGSTDRTATEARRHGANVLELPMNMGGGTAIRVGYNYAARSGAVAVVTMDADGQHRAEDIEMLVGPILDGSRDFVIGSRRLGEFEHVSHLRSIGLGFFNSFLNLLLATDLTDCSSGFRAFSTERIGRLTTSESQYHTAETIMLVRRLGLRIGEVPIAVRRRVAGESKKGNDLLYGYRFARIMLTRWLRG